MTHNDYLERKRRIEEQHQAGIELLEAGRRLQLRTLDLIWMTTAEGAAFIQTSERLLPLSVAAQHVPSPAAPPGASAPPKLKRRPAYQVHADVVAALANVPEEFTRDDILKVLDYEPDRAALHRILVRLVDEERSLVVVERGSGRLPSVYRKVVAEVPPPVGELDPAF